MSINETLNMHGITSIWHFTDKSNLKSIEEYGIQSLYNIIKNNIEVSSFGADELSHDLDKKTGLDKYVHLSFVKDHPMYHVAKRRGSIITPVWIELDLSILFNLDTRFSDQVANSNGARIFSKKDILKYIDIPNLFNYNDFWSGVESRKAEIMACNSINNNKIKGITYG